MKPRLDLIPMAALVGVSRLLEHGLEKHADDNFDVSPREPEEYVAKCLRHLSACQSFSGRYTTESLCTRDAENGLPEIDAAISNLLMLRQVLILRGVLPRDPKAAAPEPSLGSVTGAHRPAASGRPRGLGPDGV